MDDSALLAEHVGRFGEGEGRRAIVTCPGRVNIIGEHIDYMGYGVLPMAIAHNVRCVVQVVRGDSRVVLENGDTHKYKPHTCSMTAIEINAKSPQWYDYFLCGVKGVIDMANMKGDLGDVGMRVLVSGTIPPNAGLSSSSALVCAAALCTALAMEPGKNPIETDEQRSAIASVAAKCERYVGVEGGGMDQAASMMSKEGSALRIDFSPLASRPVAVPVAEADCSFVVAHTLQEANKAAGSYFNHRVIECRLAVKVMAAHFKLDWRSITTTRDLQNALLLPQNGGLTKEYTLTIDPSYVECCEDTACQQLKRCEAIAGILLKTGRYTLEEVKQLLDDCTHKEIDEMSVKARSDIDSTGLQLRCRAIHVFSEAARVLQFAQICDKSAVRPAGEVVRELASLMDESHSSCSLLYECSSNSLDKLCRICKFGGALGVRLTGAGWGGCVVALVPNSKLNSFKSTLRTLYYERLGVTAEQMDRAIFVTQPCAGASVKLM